MIQYHKKPIKVFQSALCMTTSAVIETGEAIIMTDPNWLPQEIEQIKSYIDSIRDDQKQLYVIFTHSDFDHIIGSGAFPDAKVIASKELSESEHKKAVMEEIRQFDQDYYLQRNYQPKYPEVDYVISEDGQEIHLDTCSLTFYKAPGHTNDGVFTVIEPYGIFLTGDYLSDVEFPFIDSSYTDYVQTMDKAEMIFAKHNITLQVPGHGHTTESKEELQDRLAFAQKYLQQLWKDQPNMEEMLQGKYTFFGGMKDMHIHNRTMALREKG